MKSKLLIGMLLSVLLPASAMSREAPLPVKLNVTLGGIKQGAAIAEKFAFCRPDGQGATTDGGNINPSIRWSGATDEVKSYVVLVVDRDVPASFELANQKGKVIPKDFARQDFYHWVLIDVPAKIKQIPQGKASDKVIAGGKPLGKTAYGVTGQNDYATFMKGTYGGYDGPCPPWNDERLHRYYFQVYALDVKSLGLQPPFSGKDVLKAMKGHVVGKGEAMGTYTNNPRGVKP